jgi:hypothetical protein
MSPAKQFIPILLFLGAIAALALGCGIGSDRAYQEPLSKMRITGTRTVGQELRLELDYRQTYDVDVDVECDLKQGSEVIEQIGYGVVQANPGGRPDATPAVGTLAFPFRVEKAGSYLVVCFTTKDAENKLKTPLTMTAE